jgi:CheY-like chemotaxis protein
MNTMRTQTIVVAPQCIPLAPRRRHVLLVDDDPRQLKLSAVILTATGYDVSTASCASEALDQTRFTRPDAP